MCALLGEGGGSTHSWKDLNQENKNMAFKWCTCVGIEENWETSTYVGWHTLTLLVLLTRSTCIMCSTVWYLGCVQRQRYFVPHTTPLWYKTWYNGRNFMLLLLSKEIVVQTLKVYTFNFCTLPLVMLNLKSQHHHVPLPCRSGSCQPSKRQSPAIKAAVASCLSARGPPSQLPLPFIEE